MRELRRRIRVAHLRDKEDTITPKLVFIMITVLVIPNLIYLCLNL